MQKLKLNVYNWTIKDTETGLVIYREEKEGKVSLKDCYDGRERWENGLCFTIHDFCRECLGLTDFTLSLGTEPDPMTEFSEQLREAEKHLADLRANLDHFKKIVENLKKY